VHFSLYAVMIANIAVLPQPSPIAAATPAPPPGGPDARTVIAAAAATATVIAVMSACGLALMARRWRESARVAALQGKGLLGAMFEWGSGEREGGGGMGRGIRGLKEGQEVVRKQNISISFHAEGVGYWFCVCERGGEAREDWVLEMLVMDVWEASLGSRGKPDSAA
jgi:hypothetical protein